VASEKAEIFENMQRKLLTARRKLKQALEMTEYSLEDLEKLKNLERGQLEEKR